MTEPLQIRASKCSLCGHTYPINPRELGPNAMLAALQEIERKGCPSCKAHGRYQLVIRLYPKDAAA